MATHPARTGRALIWIGSVFVLIGFAPMGFAFLASWIAQTNGCQLNEGMANVCIIGGSDWGYALYTMFVSGWLFLLTMLLIPLGLIILIIGIVIRLKKSAPMADPDIAA